MPMKCENMLEGLKWNMVINLAFNEYVSKIWITFLPTYYGPIWVYTSVRGVLVPIAWLFTILRKRKILPEHHDFCKMHAGIEREA